MADEREIKLRLNVDIKAIQRKLRQVNLRVSKKRVYEVNLLFDTPDGALRAAGKLIRVRTVGAQNVLTFKGVSKPGRHKRREEIETHLEDSAAFEKILSRLGYEQTFKYEKYRTEYRSPNQAGVVTVDETPIGNFLEIEGAGRWIDQTAKVLGFGPSDYVTDSYGALYRQYCQERGITPANMTFRARKKP